MLRVLNGHSSSRVVQGCTGFSPHMFVFLNVLLEVLTLLRYSKSTCCGR